MPREYVRPEWEPCDMMVAIGWSRQEAGGHVQLATIRDGSQDKNDPSNGLYATLDRQSINGVIRHLRRARDQAFGRDE